MIWSIETFSNANAFYFTLFVIFLCTLYHAIQTKGLPPGPIGIPFFGYWPFLKTSTCHNQLQALKEKYGDIFSFTVTGHLYINLSSIKIAREAFLTKSEHFSERMKDFNLLNYAFRNGLVFSAGEEWKTLRKFYMHLFREHGMNTFKSSMCSPIYDSIKESLKELSESKEEPLDIVQVLSKKCSQILHQTLFGENRVTYKEILEICNSYETILENMTGPNLLLIGNFARYFVLPFTKGYWKAMENHASIEKKLFSILARHKSSFTEENRRGIIDTYIQESKARRSQNDVAERYFTDKSLVGTLVQFIGDGVTTVAVFVCTFFRALLDHPEEQEKIYKELLEVVGPDRDPSIEDKSKLKYTNAFILEVIRTCEIFPFFPSLECVKETTLKGYIIPKGSILILNSWSAHHDSEEYEEPDRFYPSRYIQQQGTKRPELPVLFGIGKRSCIGEGFAMTQAFLFLTTIVKHFRLSRAVESKENLLFLVGKMYISAHPRWHD